MREVLAPLDDPEYQPVHVPTSDGGVPHVVARWGARSQLRWFRRYRSQLAPQRASYWARFHVDSVDHVGLCCESCMDDEMEGRGSMNPEHCCCLGFRGGRWIDHDDAVQL